MADSAGNFAGGLGDLSGLLLFGEKVGRLLPSGKKLLASLLGCFYVYLVCQAVLAQELGPAATVGLAALLAIPGYFVILYLYGNRIWLEFKHEGRQE